MDTDESSSNSDETAGDAPIASAEATSRKANASAQPLLASISRFAQQAQTNQESLISLIMQVGEQLRATDAKVRKNSAEIEKHVGWILTNQR